MIIILLMTSTVLLYAKSKYFPGALAARLRMIRSNASVVRIFAYGLSGLAMWRAIVLYGSGTGFVIWLFALTLVLSVLVIGLPLLYKS